MLLRDNRLPSWTLSHSRLHRLQQQRLERDGKAFHKDINAPMSQSIIIENLIGILQDCVDDPNLPTSIRHIRACAHKCWPMDLVSSLPPKEVQLAAYPNMIARFPAFILFTAECSCTRYKCLSCQHHCDLVNLTVSLLTSVNVRRVA